jgi:hypothetical protein
MRKSHWIVGLLLASPFASLAEQPSAAVDIRASAWVEVEPSGKAHVVEMGELTKLGAVAGLASIAENIRQRLRDRIESWEFTPATRAGVAVASSTNVSIALEGVDDGAGGFAVRIRSASTGPKLALKNMGGLTAAGNSAAEEGVVVVDVTYGEDGRVLTASVHDSKTLVGGKFVKRASQDLRKGLMRAAKSWVFMPEQVARHPVAGSGRVPIVFCFTARCQSAWDALQSPESEPRYAANEPVATLRSAVTGTTL